MEPNKINLAEWQKLKRNLYESSVRFMEVANKLPEDIRNTIMTESEWSPKDVLSHIVGWEWEAVHLFNAFLSYPETDDNYDIDSINKSSVLKRKNKSWTEIMQELKSANAELSIALEELNQNNLNSESRFMEWVNILIEHYDHHRLQLEKLQK